MSLASIILMLDKFADKEVHNLVTLKGWLTDAQATLSSMPTGVLATQAELGIDAILPLINLVQADLTPIATTLDKAVAAVPMTGAQAAAVVAAVVTSVSAAAPAVGAAASAAVDAIKNDGH